MGRTYAVLFGLAILCTFASPASAINLCFEVTSGAQNGSQLFLKGVDVGARKSSLVHGYYVPASGASTIFRPLHGQALVASNRRILLGLTVPDVSLNFFTVGTGADNDSINIGCVAGPDGRIGVGDQCGSFVSGSPTDIEIIDCNDVTPLP